MLLSRDSLAVRAAVVGGPLQPLASSLAEELDRLLPDEDVFVPTEKARMTRNGGRCARDGAFLEFDPTSPRSHRCSVCGTVYEDDEHYRWWIMGYQLWLAERAVHASALWRLGGVDRHRRLAEAILTRLASLYLRYPNEDNVLGPTRVFFSTYLESIWLLQLSVAVNLLEDGESGEIGDLVRERIIVPSTALIASFDEGGSNRQVWNSAALGAAGVLLDQPALIERAIHGDGGLAQFLRTALLPDGTWYEGENYHLFAHRGLWYLMILAEHVGATLPSDLVNRFESGFAAPLKTALPDFTFPSRRDSQYRASLRQWRLAESLELGLVRSPDSPAIANGLASVYGEAPAGDSARWRSTAEAERNVPGVRLTRADLGWKSLLFALPQLPAALAGPVGSALMEGQGFGVIRRDNDRVYVALDYGHSGGSHGHPDRLNLWLVIGDQRVFEDVGTGSYVERALHWYRSTLAHNAPLVDGKSQEPVEGTLRAWDERDGYAWIDAEATVADGVLVRRSLLVADGYLIDRLEWKADRHITLDLPMHVDSDLESTEWQSAELPGGSGLEDGFDFLTQTETAIGSDARLGMVALTGVVGAVQVDGKPEWWRAVAPGPPREQPRRFLIVRSRSDHGVIVSTWSWTGRLDMEISDTGVITVDSRGPRIAHELDGDTWRVREADGTVVTLDGRRQPRPAIGDLQSTGTRDAFRVIRRVHHPITGVGDLTTSGDGARFTLGEGHYRGTEATWTEAGSPTATVVVAASPDELLIETSVATSAPDFVGARSENPLDNEHPDINSDGMQIHLSGDGFSASWLLVPEPGSSAVRATGRDDAGRIPFVASWLRTPTGWSLLARIDRRTLGKALALDVIINEMPGWRERRRGQLVMSGARGESAYLRGDRQDLARLIPMVFRNE